jgi:hypothetical protein
MIPLDDTEAKRKAEEIRKCYINTFSSAEGRRVLGDIVINMGCVFDNIDPNDIAQIAMRNIALTIARMAGAFDSLYTQLGLNVDNEVK